MGVVYSLRGVVLGSKFEPRVIGKQNKQLDRSCVEEEEEERGWRKNGVHDRRDSELFHADRT